MLPLGPPPVSEPWRDGPRHDLVVHVSNHAVDAPELLEPDQVGRLAEQPLQELELPLVEPGPVLADEAEPGVGCARDDRGRNGVTRHRLLQASPPLVLTVAVRSHHPHGLAVGFEKGDADAVPEQPGHGRGPDRMPPLEEQMRETGEGVLGDG